MWDAGIEIAIRRAQVQSLVLLRFQVSTVRGAGCAEEQAGFDRLLSTMRYGGRTELPLLPCLWNESARRSSRRQSKSRQSTTDSSSRGDSMETHRWNCRYSHRCQLIAT